MCILDAIFCPNMLAFLSRFTVLHDAVAANVIIAFFTSVTWLNSQRAFTKYGMLKPDTRSRSETFYLDFRLICMFKTL